MEASRSSARPFGNVDVICPVRDEEEAIAQVVRAVPRPTVRHVIVVDNGSRDATAAVARAAGAVVVSEPRRGYGSACLAGMRALSLDTDIVAFLDGDGSDDPSVLPLLLEPIAAGRADLVVGARVSVETGSLTMQQRIGNAVAAAWLRARFGQPATDLGPLRAIRRSCLDALGMADRDYGWTVEMQVKAARRGYRYAEVPVPYRRRIGRSKISGTVRGSIGAAFKIVTVLARHHVQRTRLPS